jgi:5'-3' exonuclease
MDKVDRDLFFTVMQANYQLIESALNKVPTVNVIRLNHMEADFIPYYLLSRNKVVNDGSVANVIYSNDHDMWQCIQPHCYIFSKAKQHKKIIKSGVMSLYLKKEVNISDEYYPLAMAICGDPGDDVDGVSGVGPSGFIDMFQELVALVGTMDEIYEKVEKGENIFKFMPENIQNKKLKKVYDEENEKKTVSNNLKLVSFELISRFLESPKTTEVMDRRNRIDKILQEKQVYPAESIKAALAKTGVFLEEASIDLLYI